MKKLKIDFSEIQAARQELTTYIKPTPLLYNAWLSELYGCEVYLKLESMHPIGSFKIRGATYKIASLSEKEKKRGVIAASAGNHAQGVAWGAAKLGVKATIVMPETAPIMKIQNTKALGAEVVLAGKSYDEAQVACLKLARKTGAVMIHAFQDSKIIAGQGTVALELVDQLPDLDWIVGSIGGGGLLAGIGVAMKHLKPEVKIVGCQATGASAMIQSLKKGKLIEIAVAQTFADGIAVRKPSAEMKSLLADVLDELVVVDDEKTATAVLTLIEKAKVIAEGAAAISLAALENLKPKIKGKKVVVLICGGNIDVNLLSRILDHGLTLTGRRVRLQVAISDKPGSLSRLTEILGEQGANILQAIHDRDLPSARLNETEVSLTLETKGPDHSKRVISALKSQGFIVRH